MAQSNTVESYRGGRGTSALGPHAGIVILALVAAIPGFVLIWLISAPLFAPSLSLAWVLNAGCAAFLAWWVRAKRHTDHINLWDIAGVYAFLGCASAMISNPEQVVQLFGLGVPLQ